MLYRLNQDVLWIHDAKGHALSSSFLLSNNSSYNLLLECYLSTGILFLVGKTPKLIAYSDASWFGCPDTHQYVIGWCMFLGSSLISWKSKKQEIVSKSSTKFECCVMSTTYYEIIWLLVFLVNLDFLKQSQCLLC